MNKKNIIPNWRGVIPVYINNFNWLTSTRELADFFSDVPGVEVIIVDNASTYPPLLDWYSETDYKIVRLDQNIGAHAPWHCGAVLPPVVHRAFWGNDFYVLTDPDLSLSGCPKDVLNVLTKGWQSHSNIIKVGLSLEINDIPSDALIGAEAKNWESQFWAERLGANFFNADVDTTFALYSINVTSAQAQKAIRSDRPYTARHLPWYITMENITPEQEYYINSTKVGSWGKRLQQCLSEKRRF